MAFFDKNISDVDSSSLLAWNRLAIDIHCASFPGWANLIGNWRYAAVPVLNFRTWSSNQDLLLYLYEVPQFRYQNLTISQQSQQSLLHNRIRRVLIFELPGDTLATATLSDPSVIYMSSPIVTKSLYHWNFGFFVTFTSAHQPVTSNWSPESMSCWLEMGKMLAWNESRSRAFFFLLTPESPHISPAFVFLCVQSLWIDPSFCYGARTSPNPVFLLPVRLPCVNPRCKAFFFICAF